MARAGSLVIALALAGCTSTAHPPLAERQDVLRTYLSKSDQDAAQSRAVRTTSQQMKLPYSRQAVWTAVLQAIVDQGGEILNVNRDVGLVAFRLPITGHRAASYSNGTFNEKAQGFLEMQAVVGESADGEVALNIVASAHLWEDESKRWKGKPAFVIPSVPLAAETFVRQVGVALGARVYRWQRE